MSEPWTPQERARRLGLAQRQEGLDALAKVVGCALMLAALVLGVAGMAAVVALLWRKALGG